MRKRAGVPGTNSIVTRGAGPVPEHPRFAAAMWVIWRSGRGWFKCQSAVLRRAFVGVPSVHVATGGRTELFDDGLRTMRMNRFQVPHRGQPRSRHAVLRTCTAETWDSHYSRPTKNAVDRKLRRAKKAPTGGARACVEVRAPRIDDDGRSCLGFGRQAIHQFDQNMTR